MGSEATDSDWIRSFDPASEMAPAMVCFPHAGGSASYFRSLSAALTPSVNVLAVQYPGRQDRLREPTISSIRQLADQTLQALEPLTQPLALFGHSMGALVGYELALRLAQRTEVELTRLFVSGRRAPSIQRDEGVSLDDQSLVSEVRALGGTESVLLEDQEVVEMILPAIRSDYTAVLDYQPDPAEILTCPVTALVGSADSNTSVEEARAWKEHTRGPFDIEVLQGDHFYFAEDVEELAQVIRDRLS
jgi:pyochelin biosynthesis protein PchC